MVYDLVSDGGIMKTKYGGNDGDGAMYNGDDVDEAKIQVKSALEHGSGT
jgi:hypothetical protein